MVKAKEPELLRRGKQFHRTVQREWIEEAAGCIHPERVVCLKEDRIGRVDILVDDIGENLIAIIEVKSTDWNKIKPANVSRNIRRHIHQIWRYISAQVDLEDRIVCPGVIYPHIPQDPIILEMIETRFEAEGIQVVWHDETIDEVRIRNRKKNSC